MESRPQVIHNHQRSFLSTLALGLCSIVIALIVGATLLGLYGIRLVDHKSEQVLGTVDQLVTGLPELQEKLPPLIGDLFQDERRIDYLDHIEIESRLVRGVRRDQPGLRSQIEVKNTGDEMVTLLTLHLSAFDEDGELIEEWNEWVATPVALENELRGPLLPGSTRTVRTGHLRFRERVILDAIRVHVEVTDVRVWRPEKRAVVLDTVREL